MQDNSHRSVLYTFETKLLLTGLWGAIQCIFFLVLFFEIIYFNTVLWLA